MNLSSAGKLKRFGSHAINQAWRVKNDLSERAGDIFEKKQGEILEGLKFLTETHWNVLLRDPGVKTALKAFVRVLAVLGLTLADLTVVGKIKNVPFAQKAAVLLFAKIIELASKKVDLEEFLVPDAPGNSRMPAAKQAAQIVKDAGAIKKGVEQILYFIRAQKQRGKAFTA